MYTSELMKPRLLSSGNLYSSLLVSLSKDPKSQPCSKEVKWKFPEISN